MLSEFGLGACSKLVAILGRRTCQVSFLLSDGGSSFCLSVVVAAISPGHEAVLVLWRRCTALLNDPAQSKPPLHASAQVRTHTSGMRLHGMTFLLTLFLRRRYRLVQILLSEVSPFGVVEYQDAEPHVGGWRGDCLELGLLFAE